MGAFNPYDYISPLVDLEANFCGSAVLVSTEGHFLTARHVVESNKHRAHAGLLRIVNQSQFQFRQIASVTHHPCVDLSFGKLAKPEWELKAFPIRRSILAIGEDVYTSGFVGLTRISESAIQHETRYSKGYVSAIVQFNNRGIVTPAYELSFEVLRGLSGSPLLTFYHEVCVVGILFGSGRTEYVDDIDEDTEAIAPDGARILRLVNKRVVSFGLAHIIDSILEIPGLEDICCRFIE